MDMVNLIIALVSGVVGGNIAGSSMPDKNLGTLGNSIAGLVGGGIGSYILKALGIVAAASVAPGVEGAAAHAPDLTSILASIGAGGVSGGVITALVALVKDAMDKK